MLDQSQVDMWLTELLTKLSDAFGKRLVWVGHHGSWGRGEPRPESDIDCMVVIDHIEDEDLPFFKDIIHSMPESEKLSSGIIMSVAELRQIPRFELNQFFHGRKVLHGSIDSIVKPPEAEDYIQDIRLKGSDNLHAARHYLLFPHDLPKVVHKLKYHFKNCFYALQSWLLMTQGEFVNTKTEMVEVLDDPIDKEVVIVARDWYKLTDDLTFRARHYIELLERWGRGMIRKLESYKTRR
ncbi:nucleotidyltransferase domain-containing protein [candidate division WOR-3 bacterium]|nr:nucleotidyltransferase domain-containing protein [candidate division WOR-3 bacterium]